MVTVENKKLNKEQLEAVKHKKGPLLIIAGAGTGKTTVITERIKFLISKGFAMPSEILALTFTEKAAREMEERVDIAMPYGYTQMWISTFHSFCDQTLRHEALHIGLDPKYKLMTQSETIQLVRNNLFKFDLKYFRPLGNPTKFVGGMLQHFSRLQDEDISPAEYVRWVRSNKKSSFANLPAGKAGATEDKKLEIDKWMELSKAYQKYDELKIQNGFLDFGDLIVKTLLLFRKRPNILRQYQKQFKYLLVDEFQDTNYAQNELAILLAGKDKNITVTGDDNQSVYRFRGAAVSNILQFKKTFPVAKVVTLKKNYRSTQKILDSAYKLIQFNNPDTLEVQLGIDKNLISVKKLKGGTDIKFIHKDRVENEAEEVVKEIKKLTDVRRQTSAKTEDRRQKTENYQYRDIVILVRANNHSEPFIRALQRHAIPYQFLGPGRLFKQPEIIDLISYLKVLYNFDDSVSFYRLLSIDHFNISARDLVKISNYAKRLNLSLYEACEKIEDPLAASTKGGQAGQGVYVGKETRDRVRGIVKIVEAHLKLLKKETAGQLLYYFLERTKLLQKLLSPDSVEAEKKAKNISKLFDKLKTYEVDHEDATVPAVVDWIELASELGESPLAANDDWTENNAVNILTVHSAKGLEFPVVFLVNLVSQRFPTNERRELIPIPEKLIKEILPAGDFHEQEERRLFYVGMTRAKDRLYFTAANYYGEGKREKRLSPFIFESLGDFVVSAEQLTTNDSQQLTFLDYEPKTKSSEVLTKEGEALHIDFLSYSQIETFRICPLHYKLRYIYKIPTPPSAAQSFGISIHNALNDFYLAFKNKEKSGKVLMTKFLKANWEKLGYKSKSHERKSFDAAKKYLSDYYKKEFNPKKIPIGLEQPFVASLNSTSRKVARRHSPALPAGRFERRGASRGQSPGRRLKIGGKIDRIDALPGGKIEIIDYKTGANVPTQKQIDHNLQLTFYALAATSIKEPPFGKNIKDIVLSLYYFDGQQKISTTRTKEQLEGARREIFEWREQIEKSDFQCSDHFFCKNCEFKLLCQTG